MNRHDIMIKRLIHKKYITNLNLYAINKRASTYMKQKLTELKGQKGKSTIKSLAFFSQSPIEQIEY